MYYKPTPVFSSKFGIGRMLIHVHVDVIVANTHYKPTLFRADVRRSPMGFTYIQWTGAIPSRFVTTLCVARSLTCSLSYVHPRKTRVVPTYSRGYFTQDTVPSAKNRWVFFAQVAVSLCKSIGALPSHGEAILTPDMRTSILAHSRGTQISIHREFYAEHVGTGLELILRTVHNLRRSSTSSVVWLFRPACVLLYGAYIGNGITPVHCSLRYFCSHSVLHGWGSTPDQSLTLWTLILKLTLGDITVNVFSIKAYTLTYTKSTTCRWFLKSW